MATDGERRCARGKRCAQSAPGDGGHLLGARLTRPEGLCPACETRLERTVRQLPADVDTLDELIGDFSSNQEGTRVDRSRDLMINIRPGIEALRAEIDTELVFWAQVLGMPAPYACRLNVRVTRSAAWIGPRLRELLRLGPQERLAWTSEGEPLRDAWDDWEVVERTGLDGAGKFFTLHARVRQVAGRTKLVHALTPCCPYCDQPSLVRHNGGSVVECENPDCAKRIKEQHYDWFVEVTIREERRRQAAVA